MITAIFILLVLLFALRVAEFSEHLRERPPRAMMKEERKASAERKKERLRTEKLMMEVERYDGTAGRAGRGGNLE